jgi:chromosome partitioning protein
MARILAIANQKGGVGKTTTGINLAASLAAAKRRVLLIDLDPQGNATVASGIDKRELSLSVYDAVRRSCDSGRYDIVPANRELAGAEVEIVALPGRETRLQSALGEIVQEYDFIFIDCPPALNLLTVNGLTAAQAVMIPMQCEYYALEGLSDLVQTIRKVRANLNPVLEIEGLLRTMYDPRNMLAQQVSQQLLAHFGDKVYRTVIPRNVRLAEAPSHGLAALYFDKQSKGALAYLTLAGEILEKSAAKAAAV